ncbi:3139_t:CDS:2 [Gigaspora rosea]|nr:3139_t:CDS:2 [Gigaspora rosea]
MLLACFMGNKTRIVSSQSISNYSYNPIDAHKECSAVDPYWKKLNDNAMHNFCLLNLRKQVINLVEIHYNRHIVSFCKKTNLIDLWIYFWNNWYCLKRWLLWARAADDKISHIRTTMIMESHWRHIKHDHLYKFHKPQIDHLCFILVTRVINQQLYRLHLLQQGRYIRNENYPLIATYEGEFINPFYHHNSKALEISIIKESIIEYEKEYAIEDNNEQEVYDQNLNHLTNILDKAKNLLEQSREKPKSHLWLQNVYSNFKPLKNMIANIELLKIDTQCQEHSRI